MAGRHGSSLTRASSWILAVTMVGIYAGLALGALLFRVEVPITAPWWAPHAAAVVVYAILVAAAAPRFRAGRFLGGVIALCAVNGLLVAVTVAVITGMEPAPYRVTLALTLERLPAIALLRVIWAPLVLVGFRDLLAARARYVPRVRPAAAPRRVVAPPPQPAARPAAPTTPPVAPLAPAPAPRRPERPPAPPAPTVAPAPAPAPAPGAARPVVSPASESPAAKPPADAGEVVRIPFERVADQFPPGAFKIAAAELSARLPGPGQLLVPRSVVLPQLAEGAAHAPWDLIARQLPADALALDAAAIERGLPAGIALPLDEIVRQLPPDLFMLSGPAADVQHLEDYPVPFQPHVGPGEIVAAAVPRPGSAPAVPAAAPPERSAVETPETALPRNAAATTPVAHLELDGVSAAPETPAAAQITVDEPDPLTRVLMDVGEPADGGPPLDPALEHADPARADEVMDEPALVAPGEISFEPALASADPPPFDGTAAMEPVPDGARTAADLARHFVRLSTAFEMDVRREDGIVMFVAAPPSTPAAGVAAAASRVAPFLWDARLPGDVTQATLRGDRGVVIVTPLGRPDHDGPLLVVAGGRGGSVALLEALSQRAAADVGDRRPGGTRVGSPRRPGRRNGAPVAGPGVAGLAESLTAFGAVISSAIRRQADGLVLHMVLPRAMDAAAVGDLAADLYRAVAGDGAVDGIGTFHSAAVRLGTQCVVIREVEAAPGRATVLVAGGGPIHRSGLAHLQVERAAVHLGSRRT